MYYKVLLFLDDTGDGETCKLLPDRGPCKHSKASLKRWYFDPSEGVCKTFIYGGCLGNKNRFRTKMECLNHCAPGREHPKFYYPNKKYFFQKFKSYPVTPNLFKDSKNKVE